VKLSIKQYATWAWIILLITALVLPACAAGTTVQTPAATEEKVYELPVIADITGPYAGLCASYYAAIEDFVTATNEAGGFKGIKIKMNWMDSQGNLDRSLSYFNKIIGQKKKPPIMLGWTSGIHEAMKPLFEEQKIVLITGAASAPQFAPPGWIFSEFADYASAGGAYVNWFVKDYWPKWKPEEAKKRAPRLGAITWDSAFGRGPITNECLAYYKSIGVDWVGAEFMPTAPLDVSVQVSNMAKKNPDMVIGSNHPGAFASVLKEAVRQGLKTKDNENVLWLNVMSGADYNLPLLCNVDAYNGVMQWTVYEGWDVDSEATRKMTDLFVKNKRPPEMRIVGYYTSIQLVLIAEEAMGIALESKPLEEISGQDIYNILISGKTLNMRGITKDITYSPTRRTPNEILLNRFTPEGKLLPVTDWLTCPDLLPGGKDVPK